ncbi:MAG: SHOCT domain-containing protein [Oscillospiraceae bacterium]|nr:SHOCT domain-containing protein [Oscillospiraceae bacterium]
MENRDQMEVSGKGDQRVRVEGSSVFHTKRGHDTVIPITNITSVTIQPPFAWENSRIIIDTPQRFGGMVAFALQNQDDLPYAQNIQKYIAEFQANAETPNEEPVLCKLDQIAKLKALLDDGAINAEEFEKLKKELIG